MSHLIIATVLYIAIIAIAYHPKTANVSITINYFPEVESEPTTEETEVSGLSEPAIAAPAIPVIPSPWDSTEIIESVAESAITTVKPVKTLHLLPPAKSVTNDLEFLSIRQLKTMAKGKIKRYSSLTKSQLIQALAA